MKICPKCGKVLSYNSYFGAYICDNCNWEDKIRTVQKTQIFRYTDSSAPRGQLSGKMIRARTVIAK